MTDTQCKASLHIKGKDYTYFSLDEIASHFKIALSKLPYSIRMLLENVLSHYDNDIVTMQHIEKLAKWESKQKKSRR